MWGIICWFLKFFDKASLWFSLILEDGEVQFDFMACLKEEYLYILNSFYGIYWF